MVLENSGLTRRRFLQTTAAVGVAAATGSSLTVFAAEYPGGQAEIEGEHLAHCVCRPNCFGFCNINAHVRNGRIVKTSRWDMPDNPEYSRICARGLTHAERIYNDARLKYPMRRVEGTERGAGEWERISWDEAIDDIAERIMKYRAENGDASIVFNGQTGNYGSIVGAYYTRLSALMNSCTASPCNDISGLHGWMRLTGNFLDTNEMSDMVNAKTIISWGSNLTDSQIHHWHFVKEAKQAGAKLVVIDPMFNTLAADADEFISIEPGTDTLLAFAMMHIIYEEGLMDADFMGKRTVAPFLIREDDGRFLRNEDGECLVLEDGELVPASQSESPELIATFIHDGTKCTTAFKTQMEMIDEWPLDVVVQKTGVAEETIRELVGYYVSGPVTAIVGYGPQNFFNGAQAVAAIFMVSAMAGNLGKPGCSSGSLYNAYYFNTAFQYPRLSTSPNFNTVDWVNIAKGVPFNGKPIDLKMGVFYCSNIFHTSPNTNDFRDIIFSSMDYIVVIDSAMTDTASHADLVLPAAQHFEIEDLVSTSCTFQICYNEKAIDPPFEAKADTEIVRLIAEKIGLGSYFTQTEEEVLREMLETPAALAAGFTWEALKEKGAIRWVGSDTYIAYASATGRDGFYTSTGRLEFYTENPMTLFGRQSTKDVLSDQKEVAKDRWNVRWIEPSEAWRDNETMKAYPFFFISHRNRFRIHSQYFTVGILNELHPEPILYINPVDGQAKGIENNSYVEAFNDRGRGVGRAVYSEGVRPGTVLYKKGYQEYEHKAGSWSELLNNDYNPWSSANLFPDCACDIRPWIGESDN